MGALVTMFAIGTLWFWVLLFVAFVIVTIEVESDNGFWATVTLAFTAALLNFGFKVPIINSIHLHPGKFLMWVVIYVLVGAGWSLVKWILFVHKKRNIYEEYKATFLEEHKATELTPELALELRTKLNQTKSWSEVSQETPSAVQNKSNITRWMTYWPFSMVGFALNDVVRKIFNHIYGYLRKTYEKIAIKMFRGVQEDVDLAKQAQPTQKS